MRRQQNKVKTVNADWSAPTRTSEVRMCHITWPPLGQPWWGINPPPTHPFETNFQEFDVKLDRNLFDVINKEGVKFDQDKDRWDLLPLEVIQEVVKVLTFGAKKYAPENWKKMEDKERYYAAMMRHVCAWRSGEPFDSETGFHHLTHAMTNIMFLMYFLKKEGNIENPNK